METSKTPSLLRDKKENEPSFSFQRTFNTMQTNVRRKRNERSMDLSILFSRFCLLLPLFIQIFAICFHVGSIFCFALCHSNHHLETGFRATTSHYQGVCAYRRRLLLVCVGFVVSLSGMRLKSALFLFLEISCPDFNSLKILYRFLFHFSDNDNLVR